MPVVQPYVTFVGLAPLMLIAGAIAAVTAAVFATRTSSPPGWMLVAPGAMHWFGLFGGAALFLLIAWVWTFVGSSRADAAFQIRIAYGLALIFGVGAVWSGWHIRQLRQQGLRIRGEHIAFTDTSGAVRTVEITQFDAFRRRWRGDYQLRFVDGTMVALDPYAKNGEEFMRRLLDALDPEGEA